MTPPECPAGDLVETDRGKLWVRSAHAGRLAAAGLTSFPSLMEWAGGKVYRAFGTRLTVRIEVGGVAFYLKRHRRIAEPIGWLGWLLRVTPPTDARREWEWIWNLRRSGFGTAEPVAIGEDGEQSLLLLEEIPDAEPADDLLAREYSGPLSADALAAKRTLLRRIGGLVRRFHRGFIHRDLYLCHIFVGRGAERPLYLIDLQRLMWAFAPTGRWFVKDVAQLNYSARADFMTERDRMCLLRAYLGERLDAGGKAFLRSVFAKTERIARHDRKLQAAK